MGISFGHKKDIPSAPEEEAADSKSNPVNFFLSGSLLLRIKIRIEAEGMLISKMSLIQE